MVFWETPKSLDCFWNPHWLCESAGYLYASMHLLGIHSGVYSVRNNSRYRLGLHVRLVLDEWEFEKFETGMSRICIRCIAVYVFYRIFQDKNCCNRECKIYVAVVFVDADTTRWHAERGCESLALWEYCVWWCDVSLISALGICFLGRASFFDSISFLWLNIVWWRLFGGTLISDWQKFVSDWSEKPVSRSEIFWDDWCLILSCSLV